MWLLGHFFKFCVYWSQCVLAFFDFPAVDGFPLHIKFLAREQRFWFSRLLNPSCNNLLSEPLSQPFSPPLNRFLRQPLDQFLNQYTIRSCVSALMFPTFIFVNQWIDHWSNYSVDRQTDPVCTIEWTTQLTTQSIMQSTTQAIIQSTSHSFTW